MDIVLGYSQACLEARNPLLWLVIRIGFITARLIPLNKSIKFGELLKPGVSLNILENF